MKKEKIITTFLVIAVFSFTFWGCQNSDDSDSSGKAPACP